MSAHPTARDITVSVVLPAYNAAPFIARAVSSALTQSHPPDEVIVVNDGSPDTPELEAALAPFRGRITYVAQENGGPAAARNTGISKAAGDFVAFLDSDDEWMPGYLAAQVARLGEDPGIDLLYANAIVAGNVPEAGRELMSLSPSRGPATFEGLVTLACTVLTSCVLARRRALIEAGLFDPRFRWSEDFHLWARIAWRGGRIRYHRAALVRHTRREGSLSHDVEVMRRGTIQVFDDLRRSLPLTAAQAALVDRQIARFEVELAMAAGKRRFLQGDFAAAASHIERAAAFETRLLRRVRLRALGLGLQFAPRLLRRTYGVLRRPMPARHAEGV